ncbi:phytanoyl-CoA dioxygenase family protein [Porphyrobacter sp. YT40]|uniref:phytanoyl-CoA dioxygenase family protein n=1 Tax=Porphyrobacter sp. YT40 TaxID=2547601 RepID=UPI001144AEA0|nr:phytanoyl-CoA dioxygenase family protein [Porphyrobacter sp. YT40]QDH32986.1 phytanoyl-CoA dioxygenase family protein [Porphyrobacter sp. YT40]
MKALQVSNDTSAFEVPAALDDCGRLAEPCVRQALAMMDRHGLVILTGLLSDAEAATGLDLIRRTIADPDRSHSAFASETDNRYLRRDFCALPSSPEVIGFAAMLARRLEGVLGEYCGRTRPVLEVATFTSYRGSSHQYIHRDPMGVISLFAAVEDVSAEQGGTVFVPGTHMYGGADNRHGGGAYEQMERFRTRWNARIFRHNLAKIWRMRNDAATPLAPGELRDRVFSTQWDQHQPNLLRFLTGKNAQFSLRHLGPRTLWRLLRQGRSLDARFRLVQTAPRKGSVILYRSDLLHAGPDNRALQPRRFFGMSIARDVIEHKYWHDGYSPHPTLVAQPLTFGDLLASEPLSTAAAAPALRAPALAD